ncbi:hypothetical protein niasHT_037886 [Heterodera trifolii]|uniref:Uncharacterized protein n=1 Tax=Heterodera trifolii TaxID=157864 RepID=A0ABD2IK58_9BILA
MALGYSQNVFFLSPVLDYFVIDDDYSIKLLVNHDDTWSRGTPEEPRRLEFTCGAHNTSEEILQKVFLDLLTPEAIAHNEGKINPLGGLRAENTKVSISNSSAGASVCVPLVFLYIRNIIIPMRMEMATITPTRFRIASEDGLQFCTYCILLFCAGNRPACVVLLHNASTSFLLRCFVLFPSTIFAGTFLVPFCARHLRLVLINSECKKSGGKADRERTTNSGHQRASGRDSGRQQAIGREKTEEANSGTKADSGRQRAIGTGDAAAGGQEMEEDTKRNDERKEDEENAEESAALEQSSAICCGDRTAHFVRNRRAHHRTDLSCVANQQQEGIDTRTRERGQ